MSEQLLIMPNSTAFGILFGTSFLLPPTIWYTSHDHPPMGINCVVSLHNQGTAVLIPNGGGAYFTVFSLLFLLSVVDPQTAHFDCDDRLGLVDDDSGINSAAAHLVMICKT